MPKGKYHPSNYQTQLKAASISVASLPPAYISLPPSIPDRKKKTRSGHERHDSNVKRKLQEYQMGQARNAAMLASFHGESALVPGSSEPISPRLAPLGSPGPITPFELEDSAQAGYVVAGASHSMAANEALRSRGLERERDLELVDRMIRAEERRVMTVTEGSQSPVLRV